MVTPIIVCREPVDQHPRDAQSASEDPKSGSTPGTRVQGAAPGPGSTVGPMSDSLDLGCFSVSLAVQDLERSVAFYRALGFHELGGGDGYRILGNGPTKIGVFERMFEMSQAVIRLIDTPWTNLSFSIQINHLFSSVVRRVRDFRDIVRASGMWQMSETT